MSDWKLKIGDRVKVFAPENELLKYEGLTGGAVGTVLRFRNGKVRVELDNTGSQDSEGHNAYEDFEHDQVTLIAPKSAYGEITRENTNSTPNQVAVSPGMTVQNIRISNNPVDVKRNELLNRAMRFEQATHRRMSREKK